MLRGAYCIFMAHKWKGGWRVAHGKNNLPFTKFFQYIKHFLWLFGQTVLTQLFQLATDDMEQTNSTHSVTKNK